MHILKRLLGCKVYIKKQRNSKRLPYWQIKKHMKSIIETRKIFIEEINLLLYASRISKGVIIENDGKINTFNLIFDFSEKC